MGWENMTPENVDRDTATEDVLLTCGKDKDEDTGNRSKDGAGVATTGLSTLNSIEKKKKIMKIEEKEKKVVKIDQKKKQNTKIEEKKKQIAKIEEKKKQIVKNEEKKKQIAKIE